MRNRSTPCRGSCPLQPEGQRQLQLTMWRSMEQLQSIQTRSTNGSCGGAPLPLKTVEEIKSAAAQPHQAGDRPQRGLSG